jgi:hypothetical protein
MAPDGSGINQKKMYYNVARIDQTISEENTEKSR